MKQKIHYLFMLLLMLLTGVGGVKAETTYKLEKVTEVEAGGLYVFEQSGHVMDNSISSNALQTTTNFKTAGLSGAESYVWTLESATGGFYMKNVSLSKNPFLNNAKEKTNLSFGSKSSIWSFTLQNGETFLINNPGNGNRLLAYPNEETYTYKAYAESNASTSPHAIVVYKLVEETGDEPVVVATPTFSPEAGEVSQGTEVTISTATEGATIYYTIDGSTPTENSTKGSSVVINEFTTLKAIAVKEGCENSEVAEATYTIKKTIAGYAIDFENSLDAYVDWTMTNVEQGTGAITAHGGGYYGTTGSKATASIQTKEKIANPGLFTCYISKTSSNTSSSTWYVQVSSDGEIWTDVTTASATDMNKGSWNEVTAKLDTYSDVYVRLYYNGSTAVRTIDDISLKMSSSVKIPVISLESGSYYEAKSVTIECATDGATIYYTLDGSDPTSESTPYTDPITISETTTLKAIAIKGEDASAVATAEYKIVVTKGKGTVENPFTVADARNILSEGLTPTDVYVTGIVSGIVEAYNSQYGNISYNISDDGTTEAAQLQAYRGKGKNGADFTSDADIQVGDEVVVYGNLNKYNSTYELDADNRLVSLVRNTLSAPTFSVEAGTYKEELSVTINCATEGATIYYSFDNENWTLYENPVTISESKTLYAKAEKGDKVEIASAEYTILIDKEIQGYKYEKVTSTEDITDGQYLIVYEDGKVAFDGSLKTLDAVSNTVEVTIENNEIAATTFKQAAEFTIDVTSGTLKSASGKYIGVNSNDNGLKQTETESSYKNSFAIDEGGNAVISAVFEESTMTLRFNSASNQNRFRYYKSGQQAIQLYKLVKIVPPAAPTFSPEAGTFTAAQDVTISTTTDGAEIYYTTDGSEPTTSSSKYSAAIPVNSSTTIKAIAVKNELSSEVTEATYTIEIPVVEPGTPAAITAGFYTIKNLGNKQFVNVAGRKTVTFVGETATAPGTVIKVESNEKGQVQVLRSQGVDLPGYAERAMKYVPKVVQLVAEKLGAEGEGNLLGKDGLGKIMDKFNESFDYHLYTEQGEQGVRIYGKTPSMQPVVDFYNDNKANVDAKLPMLEDFINSAINKVLEKTGGSGASILTKFSLYEIWDKMGKTLTKPVDADSKLAFLQDVLSDKKYVWDFAYQTAMKYWKPLISHEKVQQNLSQLGDLAQYVEKIEYIRPDVKYYIVQKNGKIDFISQDNTLLKEASSEWELTAREKFTVNFDKQNVQKEKYYTTLYTDFAYTLPTGVKAMTVTKVAELNGKNIAITETIEGAVPAQTPVLLESATAGDVELTLDVTDGTAIENLLKGNDWLVNLLNITTPQVDKLFGIVHDLLKYENMESLYDRYVKEYEYLKKRNAGTVNNKYFFALSGDDIAEAPGKTNVCQFTKDEQGLAFSYNLEQSPANKAFLPGDKDPVYLSFVGDVNRDGKVSVADVNALVEIVLGKVTEADNTKNYDFEAAHVNADEDITIADVTALVNIILK